MPRALRPCTVIGCPELTDRGGKCAGHRAEAEAKRPSRQARGYGKRHQAERKRVAKTLAGRPCARGCGHIFRDGEPFHLDHNDERTGYLGPSCVTCNTSAGGKKAWDY